MNWFRKRSGDSDFTTKVGDGIVSVAAKTVEGKEAFRNKALQVAEDLGEPSIALIPSFFHKPPGMPGELSEHYSGLGSWLSVCQFAAFEILANLGERSLPLLRSVAFGEYDWIQGNAIEVLCRFASQDIERQQITDELRRKAPEMRPEAIEYAVEPLIEQAESDSNLRIFLKELRIPEFTEAIEELRPGWSANN